MSKEICREQLQNASLSDYFKIVELNINHLLSIDFWTRLFSDLAYEEQRPYLTRRILIPSDPRFQQIELVYNHNSQNNQIVAIVWDLEISYSQLTKIFGEADIEFEGYSSSTSFKFKSKNPEIFIIKTRYPHNIEKINNIFVDKTLNNEICIDPVFKFIQINIKSE